MRARFLIDVTGRVQGVGFRPFVYRLASSLGVSGGVANTSDGVTIDAEAEKDVLQEFVRQLRNKAPAGIKIERLSLRDAQIIGYSAFEILPSQAYPRQAANIPLDSAPCDACVHELMDPQNRRYLYPFISCVRCGPRYTILEATPFDRRSTSMRDFDLCLECSKEFNDPNDRRFHAQTVSCSKCGPRISVPLKDALRCIREGGVVAVKGVGGFQLMCDAANREAIRRIRAAKLRPVKPLALLCKDLRSIFAICHVSSLEATALSSAAAPIVLLEQRHGIDDRGVNQLVAPNTGVLGCMLPASPLHLLITNQFDGYLVATSANRRGHPTITQICELQEDLIDEVDFVIDHDLRIVNRADDSVVRCIADRMVHLRLGRGLAPLCLPAPAGSKSFGVGAHDKVSITQITGQTAHITPHIGSLDNVSSIRAFSDTIDFFFNLTKFRPATIASDQNESFYSFDYAKRVASRVYRVQHHHAHVLACVLENQIAGQVLGLVWDGSGLGLDASVWGGEALLVDGIRCDRVASIRQFRLPGGEQAIREPRRSALGIGYELGSYDLSTQHFDVQTLPVLLTALNRKVNAPLTSSMGRLFDAVAALLGLSLVASYEGEAAAYVEFAAKVAMRPRLYKMNLHAGILDWEPMWRAMLKDRNEGFSVQEIALGFHFALASAAREVAQFVGETRVVLSGGCFQNALLSKLVSSSLIEAGFTVFMHELIPPNDGGVSAGQALFGVLKERG